jgi:hypothetical protein
MRKADPNMVNLGLCKLKAPVTYTAVHTYTHTHTLPQTQIPNCSCTSGLPGRGGALKMSELTLCPMSMMSESLGTGPGTDVQSSPGLSNAFVEQGPVPP